MEQPKLYRGASDSRPTYDGYQRTSAQSILKMIGQPVFLEGHKSTKSQQQVNHPKKFLRFKDLHFINKRALKNLDQIGLNQESQLKSKQPKIKIKKYKQMQF